MITLHNAGTHKNVLFNDLSSGHMVQANQHVIIEAGEANVSRRTGAASRRGCTRAACGAGTTPGASLRRRGEQPPLPTPDGVRDLSGGAGCHGRLLRRPRHPQRLAGQRSGKALPAVEAAIEDLDAGNEQQVRTKLAELAKSKPEEKESPKEKHSCLFEQGFDLWREGKRQESLSAWEEAQRINRADRILETKITVLRRRLTEAVVHGSGRYFERADHAAGDSC